MKFSAFLMLLFSLYSNAQKIIVLGTAQDGGFPHIGCKAEPCRQAHEDNTLSRYVVSLALIDSVSNKWWLFEATPDMDKQLQYFQELTGGQYSYLPQGIFITHAHIGHYTGLMYLGREALRASKVPVYVLPRMKEYLKKNGPWSQLNDLNNIELKALSSSATISLTDQVRVTPFTVPHRDEYSETSGFHIESAILNYLFIPDIDKWNKWDKNIIEWVRKVDYAFLDASFYKDGELPNRAMNEVPHPFVSETMELFEDESVRVKNKIHFIHFNHTNPLLFDKETKNKVLEKGFNIAEQGKRY